MRKAGMTEWAFHGHDMMAPSCYSEFFIYLFYHDFAKIYGPPQILQKYTSAAVTHCVRDITTWPTAVGAARSGTIPLILRATTLCP
jgi:hypothetical protein